jgi:hypothetical protein
MWLTLGRFSPRSNFWYLLSSIEPLDTERLVEMPELSETRSFRPAVFEQMTGIRLRRGESVRVTIMIELLDLKPAEIRRRKPAPPAAEPVGM